jgi:hypothetical protein
MLAQSTVQVCFPFLYSDLSCAGLTKIARWSSLSNMERSLPVQGQFPQLEGQCCLALMNTDHHTN